MDKTMICLILDRSGSMSGVRGAVIEGINKFLEEQKAVPGEAEVAFVRFDSDDSGYPRIERFRDFENIKEAKPLTKDEFDPYGGTPLYDAIGKTIIGLDADWARLQPSKAIVVIFTDGQENTSVEYKKDTVRALIESRQAAGLWTFIFLGADLNAFSEASSLGISVQNTASYTNSASGNAALYSTVSASVTNLRSGTAQSAQLGGVIDESGKMDPLAGQAATSWKSSQ